MTLPDENAPGSKDRKPRVIGVRVVSQRSGTGRLALGVILVAIGALLALDNLGVVNAGHVLRFWPVIFIYFGVVHLGRHPRRLVSGIIFTFIGVVLLLDQLDILNFRPGDLIPLVLVFLGFMVIMKAVKGRQADRFDEGGPGSGAADLPESEMIREHLRNARADMIDAIDRAIPDSARRGGTGGAGPAAAGPTTETSGVLGGSVDHASLIRAFALMAGVTRRSGAAEFRGGELTAILGAVEVDLRNARPAGNVVVLDATALWGGIDILIPVDWAVSADVTPLLGAFQDNSHPPAGAPRTTLVVHGTAIMGAIEVKN